MWETTSMCVCYWEAKAIKQLQCFLSFPNFISTHIQLSAPPPPYLEGHLFEYCSICFKKWYYIKTTFGMLMWETASTCVLLGRKSNKATAVFPVLPKFYQHTYPIKCPPSPLGRALIRIL